MSYDEVDAGPVWALNFEQYPGLLVRVRRPGFSAQRRLRSAETVLADRSASTDQRLAALAELFTALADSIVSWTLTSGGRPVPVTRAAVLARDSVLLGTIAGAWRAHVLQPPAAPAERSSVDVRETLQQQEDELRRDVEREMPTEALDEPLLEPEAGSNDVHAEGLAVTDG